MTAREIDETTARLRELRADAVAHLALGAIVLAAAVAASVVAQTWALPLLVGGLASTVLGLRAFVRRAFLLDDLADSEHR